MEDNVKPLSSKLAKAIEDVGSNILVFVEGPSDQAVFEELFLDRLGKITFYAVGGSLEVRNLLNEALTKRPDIPVFGICDRDFADDLEIEARLQDPAGTLLLLTWFSIENYLLDPEAVWSALNFWFSRKPPVATATDVEATLLQECRNLRSVMAGNWLLAEHYQPMLGGENENWPRERIVEKVQYGLGCQKHEAKAMLSAKESEIDQALTGLPIAYTRVSGKHLIQRIFMYTRDQKNPMPSQRIFDYALDWLKKNKGPHPHLRRIIDEKILASNRPPV